MVQKIKNKTKNKLQRWEKEYKIFLMIKKLLLSAGLIALVIGMTGCNATATVGKTANPPWVDGSVNTNGVSVTVPLLKVGAGWADE